MQSVKVHHRRGFYSTGPPCVISPKSVEFALPKVVVLQAKRDRCRDLIGALHALSNVISRNFKTSMTCGDPYGRRASLR